MGLPFDVTIGADHDQAAALEAAYEMLQERRRPMTSRTLRCS
jgi:hypothetical protein